MKKTFCDVCNEVIKVKSEEDNIVFGIKTQSTSHESECYKRSFDVCDNCFRTMKLSKILIQLKKKLNLKKDEHIESINITLIAFEISKIIETLKKSEQKS